MSLYHRVLCCLALTGAALTTLGQYRPEWAVRYGLDWWNLPQLQEQVRRAEQERAAKADCGTALIRRTLAREEIIQTFLAGRLTLLEAAARFRAISVADGLYPTELRSRYPGATDEERQCRQIIGWADAAMRSRSASAAAQVRQRLEAELTGLMTRSGGRVTLPN